jgi:hypothetical protein
MQATLHECIEGFFGWGPEDVRFSVFGIQRHETFTPSVHVVLVGTRSHCRD